MRTQVGLKEMGEVGGGKGWEASEEDKEAVMERGNSSSEA